MSEYPQDVVEMATLAALRDIVADLIEITEKAIRADEREKIARAIEADLSGPHWDALRSDMVDGMASQRAVVAAWIHGAARIARGGAS